MFYENSKNDLLNYNIMYQINLYFINLNSNFSATLKS